MIKYEQKFTTEFTKWLKYNIHLFPKPFKFEVKVVRPDSKNFPFRELSEKEERVLLKVEDSFLIYKHSDVSQLGTPADGDVLFNMDSYIIIRWEKSKKYNRTSDKRFYIIKTKDFLQARDVNKTLDEKTAMIIAAFVGELK